MREDIKAFCQQCDSCIRNKSGQPKHTEMTSIIAEAPFNIIGVDVVGPLPSSMDHQWRYILVVIDYFTKWIELFPLVGITTEEVIDPLEKEVLLRWGVRYRAQTRGD
jgi:hypothetical protein